MALSEKRWPLSHKQAILQARAAKNFPSYLILSLERAPHAECSCQVVRAGVREAAAQQGVGKARSVHQPESLDRLISLPLSTTRLLVFWLLRTSLDSFSSFYPLGNLKCVRRKEIPTTTVRNMTEKRAIIKHQCAFHQKAHGQEQVSNRYPGLDHLAVPLSQRQESETSLLCFLRPAVLQWQRNTLVVLMWPRGHQAQPEKGWNSVVRNVFSHIRPSSPSPPEAGGKH